MKRWDPSSHYAPLMQSILPPLTSIKNYIIYESGHTVQNIAVGVSLKATLARPKSQIFSLQSALAKIFLGFRSLWYTFAAKEVIQNQISQRHKS